MMGTTGRLSKIVNMTSNIICHESQILSISVFQYTRSITYGSLASVNVQILHDLSKFIGISIISIAGIVSTEFFFVCASLENGGVYGSKELIINAIRL